MVTLLGGFLVTSCVWFPICAPKLRNNYQDLVNLKNHASLVNSESGPTKTLRSFCLRSLSFGAPKTMVFFWEKNNKIF